MHRRTFLAAAPILQSVIADTSRAAVSTSDAPAYKTRDAEIVIHTTKGYPEKWKSIYEKTIKHYADQWGHVGPTHIFLVENTDWDPTTLTHERKAQLEASIRSLKRKFSTLQGHDADGQYLDWQTGNHWAGWSITPAHLTITMTMTPIRDAQQFVIGPIHEYTHALQTAYGFSTEAIDGNRMGHSRWTGPAWWREGSAVLISYLYSYQNPKLFTELKRPMTWERFSHEMNRNLSLYQKANLPIRTGVTHDDWQRLEKINKVHPVVYAGGSVACAKLLQRVGSLKRLFAFLHKVPDLGWEPAFEQHFNLSLKKFYEEFENAISKAQPQMDGDQRKSNWASFLKEMQ
ncbi:MAG: hypothetical protein CMM07_00190 [Rhodopirellula sp.]|nr:hypothetical protein [Rhodopirellula sp.]